VYKKHLIPLINTYFDLIDSDQKRQELVDLYVNSLPRKLSSKEKESLKEKLLNLPLAKWC